MHTFDPQKTLLIATHNQAKCNEIRELLADLNCTIVSLSDLGIEYDVEEIGKTFEENAILKAHAYTKLSGLVTIADDSGLEVDALGGQPGIYSNRYAGEGATDEQKCQYLLEKMHNVPIEKRQAHFTVVLAIGHPSGEISLHKGFLYGVIALEARGTPIAKFPYRRIFELPDYGKTLAELIEEGVDLPNISPRKEVVAAAKRELVSYFNTTE